MTKYFVVSDVHSFYDAMIDALNKQGFDIENPDHKVIVCGDLFDRGPDTVKCFEFCSALNEADRLIYICGNHEDLLFQCVHELLQFRYIKSHHSHNGTVDTIAQITGINKYDLMNGVFNEHDLLDKLMPLMDFITYNTYDYVVIGDYVFVHGWIPCKMERVSYATTKFAYDPEWEKGDWAKARWTNGIEAAFRGAIIPDKTVVCGHFHCSYGWSKVKMERKEFPSKSRSDWAKSFEIYTNDGIIALDACTAFSGFTNCWTLEVDDE